MPISQYSTIVNAPTYVPPIPLEYLAQGYEANEARAVDVSEGVDKAISYYDNFPTASPQDKKVLQEKLMQYKSNIDKFATQDLGNPQVGRELTKYVKSIANDEDILAITTRGTIAAQEQKKRAEAEAKGRQYTSPILDGLSEYANSGTYLRNPNLSYENGWVNSETDKTIKQAVDMAPDEKRAIYDPKTGQYTNIVTKNKDNIRKNLEILYSQDPNAQKTLDYNFKKQYKNLDFANKGREIIDTDIYNLQDEIYKGRINGIDVSDLTERLASLNKIKNNPNMLGSLLKDKYYQDYKNDYFNTVASANDYLSNSIPELSESDKLNRQLGSQKALALYNAQLDAGQIKGIPAKTTEAQKQSLNARADVQAVDNYWTAKDANSVLGLLKAGKYTTDATQAEFTPDNKLQLFVIGEGNKKVLLESLPKEAVYRTLTGSSDKSQRNLYNDVSNQYKGQLPLQQQAANVFGNQLITPNYTPEDFVKAEQYVKDSLGVKNPTKVEVERFIRKYYTK